ncbi:MAG: 23S rRNA (pseudouridine(1915)-N(3))-methyltransferase RlmH [Bacilli bacterium]|nr:23S rRNA (pseudouridine(1915)-N(3))-methyltransferase RlmH [Bacilli bacterium]
MIKIICVGKVKETFFKEAIYEYKKRLSKYTNLEIIEVEDEKIDDSKIALKNEAEKIKKLIKEKDYIITLEIEGKNLTSEQLSEKINNTLIENSNIVFVIGGSHGLSEEIKIKSNFKLSFSKMTFPHQLFRILLLEQIYRSFKIINNERYHK